MTDCADLSELVDEFGSIVEGLRWVTECLMMEPVSEPDCDRKDGSEGVCCVSYVSEWCWRWREGAVRTVCGLCVLSPLL